MWSSWFHPRVSADFDLATVAEGFRVKIGLRGCFRNEVVLVKDCWKVGKQLVAVAITWLIHRDWEGEN